jgi:acetylglutamate kinase
MKRWGPIVIKFGGELLENREHVSDVAATIARLSRRMQLVIVHGGGREIDSALSRAGIEKRQVDGLRITDEPTLDVVVSVLAGLVNTRFVAALGAAGVQAVGLTGADATIGRVTAAGLHRSASGAVIDLGRVGEPAGKEKPALLIDLCRKGYVPVVASIGASRGGELFNVNADTLAAHLAARLRSRRLIIAGATAGVLDREDSTIADISLREIDRLVGSGDATAGMVAKLVACRRAVENGAEEVFIADGRDLAGLAVLAQHGRAAGAAKGTRISSTRGERGGHAKATPSRMSPQRTSSGQRP